MVDGFTERQRQILTRLAQSRVRKEIAAELGISVAGVDYQLARLGVILGLDHACDKSTATRVAILYGWVKPQTNSHAGAH